MSARLVKGKLVPELRLLASGSGQFKCGGGFNDLWGSKADLGVEKGLLATVLGCAEISASGGLQGSYELGVTTASESSNSSVVAYRKASAGVTAEGSALCLYSFAWSQDFYHPETRFYPVNVGGK